MKTPALALAAALIALIALSPARAQQAAAVDPKAIKALSQIGEKLRSLKEYTVSADVKTRAPLASGEYRDFSGTATYRVRAPDRLHATTRGIGLDREIVFDGRTITVFSPTNKQYARIDAPGTLSTLVSTVEARTGYRMVLAQLFAWEDQARMLQEAERASYSGEALVGGRRCAHYSYKKAGIAWEVFADAQHLPCKLAFVDTRDKGLPGYTAELTWVERATLPDSTFVFTPPAGASEVGWDAFRAQGP
ncbi:DUF2092 domain-containing protein [Lysobacter arvi]|uniref:DUF2092 domain-containing protein n=1 Tax=Lysobacter arvi TaxID=3038776 RepID=A0ABU1CAI9_9GAMM|nr:DUF2092 domain-containing protein [Lysobacter arvi]MDR0182140.1 DUF2092 domain-containing protein [Lysobacter arvi]